MTFIAFLLGLAVGSFLNVLIDRIPKGEDIVWKPSHCDYCNKPLRWFELIPLVSFLVVKARCLRCHKILSWQYPLVELVAAIGFVLLYPNIFHLIIYSAMLVLFVIDWKHMILPDIFLSVVLVAVILLGIPLSPADRWIHVVTGISSGVGFFVLWVVTRGRGLGFGDVKLAGVLGALLGFPLTIVALYTAFLTGAIWGVILMVRKRASMKSRVAFGPFLIAGAAVALLWGETLWKLWLSALS